MIEDLTYLLPDFLRDMLAYQINVRQITVLR